jgi:hypothetical protein
MADSLYRVTFPDPMTRQMVTLRVREVSDSGLGPLFVRLSDFVFENPRSTIINPNDEALASRYTDTRALHVNRMSLIQVEEVSDAVVELSEAPNVVPFKAPE